MTGAVTHRSAVIAGTARNVGRHLDVVLANIESIARLFDRCHVILHECLSGDDSRARLERWGRETDLPHTLDFETYDDPDRITRIAAGRNRLLELLEGQGLADHDLLVMLDMDEANGSHPIDLAGIRSSFDLLDSGWDVVTANQRHFYYDWFALRTERYDDNPYGPEGIIHRFGHPQPLSVWLDSPALVRSHHIPPDHPPIPVRSAFGGLAIYRLELLEGLRYAPRFIQDVPGPVGHDCEHVDLHRKLREERGGRIVINPRMINRTYSVFKRILVHPARWTRGLRHRFFHEPATW